MWVNDIIAMLVMMSVSRHPFDWMTLDGETSSCGHSVLNPLWSGEALMGKLSMIGNSNTEGGNHITEESKLKGFWSVGEWGEEGNSMDASDELGDDFVLLVHLLPTLVNLWEHGEVPELLVTEWSEGWNVLRLSVFSDVILQGHLDHLLAKWARSTHLSLWLCHFLESFLDGHLFVDKVLS